MVMQQFDILTTETLNRRYQVEATDEAEARAKFEDGEVTEVLVDDVTDCEITAVEGPYIDLPRPGGFPYGTKW